jgi:hypothetical protein
MNSLENNCYKIFRNKEKLNKKQQILCLFLEVQQIKKVGRNRQNRLKKMLKKVEKEEKANHKMH